MRPVSTPRTDRAYQDCKGTEVFPLPCYEDDCGEMASTWELDDDDREAIVAGGQVRLTVAQDPPPPVGMIIVGPWCEEHQTEMWWSTQLKTWTCPVEEDDE